LEKLDRNDDARAVFKQIVTLFRESQKLELKQCVVSALRNLWLVENKLNVAQGDFSHLTDLASIVGDDKDKLLNSFLTMVLLDQAIALYNTDKYEAAILIFDQLTRRLEADVEIENQRQLTFLLNLKGESFVALKKFDAALEVYDNVIDRFADSGDTYIQKKFLIALSKKAALLSDKEKYIQAISIFEEIISRCDLVDEVFFRDRLVWALIRKGSSLAKLDRTTEAVNVFDIVISRFGNSNDQSIQNSVGSAAVNKGYWLGKAGKTEESIAAYNALFTRFQFSQDPEIKGHIVFALLDKGALLRDSGKTQDALKVFDQVVQLTTDKDSNENISSWVSAMVKKGSLLNELSRFEEAIEIFEHLSKVIELEKNPKLERFRIESLVHSSFAYAELEKPHEALNSIEQLIAEFDKAPPADLKEHISTLHFWKGWHLFCSFAQGDKAEAAFRKSLLLDPDSLPTKANLCWTLIHQAKMDEAASIFEELDDFSGAGRWLWEAGLELGLDNLGSALEKLGKVLEIGLEDKGFEYFEALIWFLRIGVLRGHGERLLEWFIEKGNNERFAPVYGALVAHVRGERCLLDLNPEIRSVARPLYMRLAGTELD